MLKKHMAACLVATAFAAAPALAQTSATPSTDRPTATGSGSAVTGSSAMKPAQPMQAPGTSTSSNTSSSGMNSSANTGGSTMNSTAQGGTMNSSTTAQGGSMNSSTMAQGGMASGQFMTAMQGNQMLASKLIGTTVVSANNESIGDVNDVVLDSNGRAMAVVVGVGGFLGIGEKDVALPYSSLQFASREQMNAMNNQKSGSSASGTAATSNNNVAATGSTNSTLSSNGGPDRIVLNMTKDQLKAAPSFHASSRGGDTAAGGTSNAPAGATTAPKQ